LPDGRLLVVSDDAHILSLPPTLQSPVRGRSPIGSEAADTQWSHR
jgi:hypothetical protein